ncbi:hypothetical protein LSTR_LSTR003989 [Laodelphax striatellus]|uniref:UV-stimulated scaffold protein A C-terminal domain-containing protein n=1 Tax=Laodelphax striatellus TaxID=195883 RepID=A0A482WFY9_LAOST|nr:hypothetical protein LSTR_LSTR003989 [Laodelphax striatellus]
MLVYCFPRRSLIFRELVVHNLQNILELTTEVESKKPLPLPKKAAEQLEKLALKTVHEWYKEFGSKYKTFECAIKFLQHKRQVDFKSLQVLSAEEREKRAENERRIKAINEQRYNRVNNEFNDLLPEIISIVKSFENGLALLLPRPEEFYISDQAENESDNTGDFIASEKSNDTAGMSCSSSDEEPEEDFNPTMREIGALTNKHTVEVDIVPNSIIETSENTAILENVRDANKMITNNYLPKIKAWLQIVSKIEGSTAFLKKLVDYKSHLEKAIERYKRLNILQATDDDCVSTDSELEEVVEDDEQTTQKKKKSGKTVSPVKNNETVGNWSIISKEEKSEDPTTVQAVLASHQKKNELNSQQLGNQPKTIKIETITKDRSSTSVCDEAIPSTSKETNQEINERKRKLLEKAPKLPFDIDLYHWEDTELKAPTILPVALDGHRFWSSVSDDNLELTVPEGSSMLRTRVIEYVGEFEPISRSCRYPLPSGKLCPRQDRYKCPFHGPIVPRDELGKCINADDEHRLKIKEEKQNSEKPPDWQDPALLQAIKMETGVDLKMPDKKGKQKKKKYPGLTDIKKSLDTTTNRLNKKIFDKASMRRVASRMDSIDRRRYRDKFGDQFNYMYE